MSTFTIGRRGECCLPLAVVLALLLFLSCDSKKSRTTASPEEIVTTRTVGLAYLEENRLDEAEAEFRKLIDMAPDEAIGYANLGLIHLRRAEFAEAERRIREALARQPDDPEVRLLLAEALDARGERDAARDVLSASLQQQPDHVKTLYTLAEMTLQEAPESEQAAGLLGRLVRTRPGNLAARLQFVEVLLRRQQADSALAQLEELQRQMPELPKEAKPFFDRGLRALQQGDAATALTAILTVHNYLKATPFYQADIRKLKGQQTAQLGAPLLTLSTDITLQPENLEAISAAVRFSDATANSGLDELPPAAAGTTPVIAIADFDTDGHQDVYIGLETEGGQARHFLFKNDVGLFIDITNDAGIHHSGADRDALFADVDNDGYLDLFVLTSDGGRLYKNADVGKFSDVTSRSGLEAIRPGGRLALFADFDHDGDLDLFVAGDGGQQFFRNNLDGTFTEQAAQMGLADGRERSRQATFADFDDDGDLDLVVASEAGGLALYTNLRLSAFANIAAEAGLDTASRFGALAAGDYTNDGFADLFAASLDGGYVLYRNKGDGTFEPDTRSTEMGVALRQLRAHDAAFLDYDNDGFLDVLVAGEPLQTGGSAPGLLLFRNDGTGIFRDRSSVLPAAIPGGRRLRPFDYNEDGDLDFILAGSDGRLRLLRNDGGNANKYLKLRLVGVRAGSGKNNHFGIGAKVEVRAGDLYQTRVVTAPMTHFGLGQRLKADVVRILWPNGTPQNLFFPGTDQDLVEQQTLKGSCAFLYTWNGERYEFHTDIMWRSALGMPLGIMGGEQAFAAPFSSDEHLLIPGDRIKPQGNRYILQITEELWETAYFDKVRLIAVDHPDSVDIFLDERFTPPPAPPHRIYVAGRRYSPVAASDQDGVDLLDKILHKDEVFISNLRPSRYQGLTEMRDLVLDLGTPPDPKRVRLYMHGWLFPSDASINVAMAQSEAMQAVAPMVQVPDKRGRWQTVIPALGFPMGKSKTIVVDLHDKFLTDDYRVRLRTNMQIYWDYVFYTCGEPEVELIETELAPVRADLHYRGFSRLYRKGGRYGPHWFDYSEVSTEPQWRDLEGYYTRYGDVRELLLESDSRYVIMNAGDEVTVEFDATALPPLPPGWKRDFLIYSDGWIKDGDLNTAHGQHVHPLPFHGLTSYPYGPDDQYPAELEAYNQQYNTRKVDTEAFRRSLYQRTDR